MFEIMDKGGLFMYILLGFSVFTLIIIMERVYVLCFKYAINVEQFLLSIVSFIEADKFTRAVEVCNSKPEHPVSIVMKSALLQANSPSKELQMSMEEATLKVIPVIQKRTSYLSMNANVAVLLGLLGTIFGLIKAFAGVGLASAAQKQEILAKGISIAMFTTAFGLIIAIPSILTFTYLQNKQNSMIDSIEQGSVSLLKILTQKKRMSARKIKK